MTPRPLTLTERNARSQNWLSYRIVVRYKDGNEDWFKVQALNEEDARYRAKLRSNVKTILNVICDGEAY